ncbi:MAG TPA: HD domain-containing phosphohydrolase [Thermoanaerobaculia bacterium]
MTPEMDATQQSTPPRTERPLALLLHGADVSIGSITAALDADRIERRGDVHAFADLASVPTDVPAVLLVSGRMARSAGDAGEALDAMPSNVVALAADGPAEMLLGRAVLSVAGLQGEAVYRMLQAGFRQAATQVAAARARKELSQTREQLAELNRIGMALMTEHDPDRLLVQILSQARRMTHSDAGSLYLVERGPDESRHLRFKLSQNDTLPDLPFTEFTLPLDRSSLAGYAAITAEPLSLEDVYHLSAGSPFSFNRSFDERFGYRTKSMLVVPMADHRGEVVGVVQLINRKTDAGVPITSEDAASRHVVAYRDREQQIVQSLAGQAAVSIENSRLYAEIQMIFESFVKAAVTAIDQRDPTTAGHSVRVATLTVDIAEVLPRSTSGPYREVRFSPDQLRELRYAALLHDFGKVGVREEVLIKAKKLPPTLFERVEARFDLIRRTIEADFHAERALLLEQAGADTYRKSEGSIREQYQARMLELDELRAAVRRANEPSVLPEAAAEILESISLRTFRGPDESPVPYVTQDELHFLRIPKGSLDERERREIESHVEQTYRFLTQIPWTDDLRNVAEIAYGHHEKLDGRGYPRGVVADEIPIQTRIMTIADIFDALTASDRPYKRALPAERALDILKMEAKEGMLDAALVDLLIDSQIYRRVLEQDWRAL